MKTNTKHEFVFYYKDRVRTANNKEQALSVFRNGGFYMAVCYFPEHSASFRIIENEEDILSL